MRPNEIIFASARVLDAGMGWSVIEIELGVDCGHTPSLGQTLMTFSGLGSYGTFCAPRFVISTSPCTMGWIVELLNEDPARPISLAGCVGSFVSTSLRLAYGSCPFIRADWIKLMIAAARLPLRSDPANNQFECPLVFCRIWFFQK